MSFKNNLLAASIAATLSVSAFAEEVQIEHKGIKLNADLQLAEGKALSDGVLMLTHGTLAHNKMELISYLQEMFVENGVSTLAINLSYGISNRASEMYDCSIPAQHTMAQAIEEMAAWQSWLDNQGAGKRWVMGHSRGGNQTAQFAASYDGKLEGQILLAPATWDYASTISGYKEKYNKDVLSIISDHTMKDKDYIVEGASILYCGDSGASLESLSSYYDNNPMYDTPYVLKDIKVPTIVIAGSLDEVVPDLPEKLENIQNSNVSLSVIEDADHFFRDIMADDVVDASLEYIEEHGGL